MGMPKQGSTEQIMAGAMTNKALATRIGLILNNRRAFDKRTADAVLAEAQRRLYWADAYNKHMDSEPVAEPVKVDDNKPTGWPSFDLITGRITRDEYLAGEQS
jgi:thiamine biosynthesis protein ThiC